ncbi:hypothetical protein PIB30_093526 [Stylosanthes scabra]|uniref:Putative plant transposon protein domain-containing protein n=1 Tax=Stylosanthes scabra TaxID=79078 RepID=A0ABU6UXP7_9FABA|nr:hypothetical protein [Stylosanthes scabra]
MADRKRKGKAVSSSSQVPRFKTLYHEAHFKAKLSARKVLLELIIQVDESILDPCGFQIQQRKWERFTKPIQAVGHLMIKEFYANAWEPEKEKRKRYTYTTMVRGKDISFAPSNIKRVLKLRKDPIPNAASYHERKANKDYGLEHVLEDLCIVGVDWVRHKDGRPHYLRRANLEPMTKGWYEFVCISILPTTNHSELTVERAVLIHSIIIGENINVEEIIPDQIYKFVYKTDPPFSKIIAALSADAKISAIPDDTLIPQEPPILGITMTRARNPRQARQATPPQQQPPQEQPQSQVHHQQDFPPNFYTHFDASMSQIYRRLDQQQEKSRKSFEAINTRMDHMDDQLSFLCFSNQMANEQMLFAYQNTSRKFKEMEMQGIPVTMANLAIHRQKEEEMNQKRMRYDQILQEAAAQQAKEAKKGKAREVVPYSEEELVSSESEEW